MFQSRPFQSETVQSWDDSVPAVSVPAVSVRDVSVPGRFSPGRFSPGRFSPGRFSPGRLMVIFLTITSISLLHALGDGKLTNHRLVSVPDVSVLVMVILSTIISNCPVIYIYWVMMVSKITTNGYGVFVMVFLFTIFLE